MSSAIRIVLYSHIFTTNGYDNSIALVHTKSNLNSRLYSVNHLQVLPPAVLCIRCTKSKQQKGITLAQWAIMEFSFPNFYSGNLLSTIVSFGSQTFKCVPKIHLMRWDEDYRLLLESRSKRGKIILAYLHFQSWNQLFLWILILFL